MIKGEELEKIVLKYQKLEDQLNESIKDREKYISVSKEYSELKPIVEQINIFNELFKEIADLNQIIENEEKELVDIAKKELIYLKLASKNDIIDACVVRQKKAYPVYNENYILYVNEIRKDIKLNYPNLHLVGRNGMHKYNNQDHAMMTGLLTAENIMKNKEIYNIWDVNDDAEYHESGISGAKEALMSVRKEPKKIN